MRRWAGEQAISSVVEMRIILADAMGLIIGRVDDMCFVVTIRFGMTLVRFVLLGEMRWLS